MGKTVQIYSVFSFLVQYLWEDIWEIPLTFDIRLLVKFQVVNHLMGHLNKRISFQETLMQVQWKQPDPINTKKNAFSSTTQIQQFRKVFNFFTISKYI
jgi:flagellar biosynthesis protein FlhB